ncbi:MAG: thioredoxin-dependent thiol peroxidase [Salinivirgaceae bacterium]|jgi:peroxiredoxin Q/BCP|nr:thioredoxin-dependent thiol peroxidase [Salinivirgaceae bacterium]
MSLLEIGAKAPAINAKNQDGEAITLEQFKGKKVILYFYPKDSTPGCTAESCNLRDNYEDLLGKGFDVIGVSPDSEASHLKFIEKQNLPFNLIADTEKEVLKAYGAWGPKNMYGRIFDGVLRTTYIINENGVIEKVFAKVKIKEHVEQILKEMGM